MIPDRCGLICFGPDPKQFAVVPLPGARSIEIYLNGGSLREYPFAIQSMESTADELARLESAGWYEAFTEWIEQQNVNGNYPELGEGKKATGVETTSWAFLYQEGESDTGIYQIQCKLEYEQEPLVIEIEEGE